MSRRSKQLKVASAGRQQQVEAGVGPQQQAAAAGRSSTAQQRDGEPAVRRSSGSQQQHVPRAADRVHGDADATWCGALTDFLTLYALFGDDLRLLATEKSADMYSTSARCSLELVAASIGKDD